jgi:hypothetical protein
MTISEAITRLDSLKPNGYSQTDKIGWLSIVDGMIKNNIIDTHEGGEGVTFNGYNDDTPLDTELIVKAPYDELYISWLSSKVDFHNGEFTRYNNNIVRYNDTLTAYSNHYNRTHMPKGKTLKYF